MNLNTLVKHVENYYNSKNIHQVRFNALNKIISFLQVKLKESNPEIDEIFQLDKKKWKVEYEQYKQNQLNGAENQVFNDLYTIFSRSNDV